MGRAYFTCESRHLSVSVGVPDIVQVSTNITTSLCTAGPSFVWSVWHPVCSVISIVQSRVSCSVACKNNLLNGGA